jgi:tetratricopeptide (TPR) repeat protein
MSFPARFACLAAGILILSVCGSSSAARPQEDRSKADLPGAELLYQQGKYRDALARAEEDLRAAEASFGAKSVQAAQAVHEVGRAERALGHYREAQARFKWALGIVDKPEGAAGSILAQALADVGGIYEAEGRPAEAEPLCERALRVQERVSEAESLEVAARWKDLGVVYYDEAKYAKAEAAEDRALAIEQKILKNDDPELALMMTARATLYADEGKFEQADKLYQQALAIEEKLPGHESRELGETLCAFGNLLYNQEKLPEAAQPLERALAIQEKVLGPEHPLVAVTLEILGDVYTDQGKLNEAEALFKRALEIDEKSLGAESQAAAYVLNGLGMVHVSKGELAEGEAVFRRSLPILEKFLGGEHPLVASSLNNLADTCLIEGKFAEAETLLKRSIAIRERNLGPDHPDLTAALNNLGEVYDSEGKYADAELLFRRVIALDEKSRGECPGLALNLNNLAALYTNEGKYAEAEETLQRAISIWSKTLPANHPLLATAHNNLAFLYQDLKQDDRAEALFQETLAVQEKVEGPEHPDVAITLNNLAELRRMQNRYTEAEPLYQRTLAIREKVLGPAHPLVAQSKNNLAMLYKSEGQFDKAEALFLDALKTYRAALGSETPEAMTESFNLASLYFARDKETEAQESYENALGALQRLFAYTFTYMGERDRLAFLKAYGDEFAPYFSFCAKYGSQNAKLLDGMYDVLLWHKGMVSQSVAQLFAAVEAAGDQQSLALLGDLSAKRKQLATLLSSPGDDLAAWRQNVKALETQAEELESRLVRASGLYAEKQKLQSATVRDVQRALQAGEAAVEFVRYESCTGKGCSGKFKYAALVLTPEFGEPPAVVNLGEAKELEGEGGPVEIYQRVALAARHASLPSPRAAARFYEKFWKPIEPYLKNAKTVYVSPDGVLNQVSLGIVPTESGEPLVERYDLRIVTSTRDLLARRGEDQARQKTAVLVGNPKYSLSEEEYRVALNELQARSGKMAAAEKRRNPAEEEGKAGEVGGKAGSVVAREMHPPRSRGLEPGGPLEPLPGTAKEISSIQELLTQRNWDVSSYENEKALEEAVKTLRSPRVLHIATHGFFEQGERARGNGPGGMNSSGLENPMLRSGLYFAGADRAVAKKVIPEGQDDGVLTAYEAMTINLQGTELVVLSACETGLGDVASGEGVFGLLRAFQEAGAESTMVSMWRVPDEETQELMKLFYEKWLSGMEKHQALREAQLEMRKRMMEKNGGIDLPYYWGAFVLVGKS